MNHSMLLGSAATCLALAFSMPVPAAPMPDNSADTAQDDVAVKPATACAADIRAFSQQMRKDGTWLGGSDYGYGYAVGGYGYGYGGGYAMGGYPVRSRSGYEVRTLLSSANILAQNGRQDACEKVLAATRVVYKRYAADIASLNIARDESPDTRQQQQIAGAQPVTDQTAALGSRHLIDTDVRNTRDVALGSVHDLVISPQTGKIAYLIIGRGGLFGFDRTYVPVPWTDFKITANLNLLVLDTSKSAMNSAPAMTDAQFTAHADFAQQSQKVDAYWQMALSAKTGN